MDDIVIQTIDVHKTFRVGMQDVPVLKGISIGIKRGDFALILGASGSGKSTLLHTILGLEHPTSGTVNCLGIDLYKLDNEDARSDFRKRHVGMVYQQANWIKALSVVENVAFPLTLLGYDKSEAIRRAWESLQFLNMQTWVSYTPTELSGGQQQKVALARALVTNPDLIIADEPTGNLDFESGKELMQHLSKFHEQGKTIVMVTHDLEYVKYAKTAIRIKDGVVLDVNQGDEEMAILRNELMSKLKRGNTEDENN